MDSGADTGQERLTIQEAARRLGVSEGAIRKRVARGTLAHDKAPDGRVYVYLDEGVTRGVDAGIDEGVYPESATLISEMRARIEDLKRTSKIVIQPLAFLGGVFYSVEMLPDPLRVATYFNPIFYAIDAFRFASLGVSDVPPYPALTALLIFAFLAFLGTTEMLRRGHNLRY